MTSSPKPEVHNVSQRRNRRTEPCPQSTYTAKLVKYSCVVFDMREDRQCSSQYLAPTHLTGEVSTTGSVYAVLQRVCSVSIHVLWHALCLKVEGRGLPPETITLGGNRSVSAGVEADWSRDLTRSPVISAVCSVTPCLLQRPCRLLPV